MHSLTKYFNYNYAQYPLKAIFSAWIPPNSCNPSYSSDCCLKVGSYAWDRITLTDAERYIGCGSVECSRVCWTLLALRLVSFILVHPNGTFNAGQVDQVLPVARATFRLVAFCINFRWDVGCGQLVACVGDIASHTQILNSLGTIPSLLTGDTFSSLRSCSTGTKLWNK